MAKTPTKAPETPADDFSAAATAAADVIAQAPKVKAIVISAFSDAGTGVGDQTGVERNFKVDDQVELTEGELANFSAAGFVRAA